MNNKGQMMVVGLIVLAVSAMIWIAMLPAISSLTDGARGCSYYNCAGYVDKDQDNSSTATCSSTNQSFISTVEEDTLACTMLDVGIPLLIIIVLMGLGIALMQGRLVEQQPPAY